MNGSLFDLKDKVAVVTGAASGIPKSISIAFSKAGAHVALVDQNAEKIESIRRYIQERNGKAVAIQADVASEEDVMRMVEKTVKAFTRIDILVAGAGIRVRKPVLEITREEFDKVQQVNLTGVFLCGKYVGKVMVEQNSGSIINFASIHGLASERGIPEYSASKGGVVQITKAMALEWAPFNVRVNAICPGVTRTPGVEEPLKDPKKLAEALEKTPMKRLAEPEEMVGPAIFLGSDASRFVTGTCLVVDGGRLAW